MSIIVTCSCGSELEAPASAAGKKVRCPDCKKLMLLPARVSKGERREESPAKPAKTVKDKRKMLLLLSLIPLFLCVLPCGGCLIIGMIGSARDGAGAGAGGGQVREPASRERVKAEKKGVN